MQRRAPATGVPGLTKPCRLKPRPSRTALSSQKDGPRASGTHKHHNTRKPYSGAHTVREKAASPKGSPGHTAEPSGRAGSRLHTRELCCQEASSRGKMRAPWRHTERRGRRPPPRLLTPAHRPWLESRARTPTVSWGTRAQRVPSTGSRFPVLRVSACRAAARESKSTEDGAGAGTPV